MIVELGYWFLGTVYHSNSTSKDISPPNFEALLPFRDAIDVSQALLRNIVRAEIVKTKGDAA